MTPHQFRAARALLNVTLRDMAFECNLGLMTVVRFEAGVSISPKSVAAMKETIERMGVMLIDADAVQGEGVRLAASPDLAQDQPGDG